MLAGFRAWFKTINAYEAAIGVVAILSFLGFAVQTFRLKTVQVEYANHLAKEENDRAEMERAKREAVEKQAREAITAVMTEAAAQRDRADVLANENAAIAAEEKKNGPQAGSAITDSVLERMRRRQNAAR